MAVTAQPSRTNPKRRAWPLVVAVLVLLSACSTQDAPAPDKVPDTAGARERADRAAEVAESVANGATSIATVPPDPYLTRRQDMLAAGYTPDEIDFAKGVCAGTTSIPEMYTRPAADLSAGQIREIQGWLMLCPENLPVAALQGAIDHSIAVQQERDAGTRVFAGTFVVGQDIQPGTYVVEQASPGCYWERTDASGEIIDNNFVTGATRVQVTIRSTDYSFTNQGCGKFVRQP